MHFWFCYIALLSSIKMLVVLFSSLFGKNNSLDGLMNWRSVPWPRLFMYKSPWYSLVQVLMQLLKDASKLFVWCWWLMSSSYISKENTCKYKLEAYLCPQPASA